MRKEPSPVGTLMLDFPTSRMGVRSKFLLFKLWYFAMASQNSHSLLRGSRRSIPIFPERVGMALTPGSGGRRYELTGSGGTTLRNKQDHMALRDQA